MERNLHLNISHSGRIVRNNTSFYSVLIIYFPTVEHDRRLKMVSVTKTMPISTSFEETLEWAHNYKAPEDSQYNNGVQVGFLLVFVTVVGICLFLIKDKYDIIDGEELISDSEEEGEFDSEEEGEFDEDDYYDDDEYSEEPIVNEMRPGSIERSIHSKPRVLTTSIAPRY